MNFKRLVGFIVKGLQSYSADYSTASDNLSVGKRTPYSKFNYDIEFLINKLITDFNQLKIEKECTVSVGDMNVSSSKLERKIEMLIQEIHNKLSIQADIEPSNIVFADFSKNPKMFEFDMYDVAPNTNNLYINSADKVVKTINSYDLLQYLFTVTFQNKINKCAKTIINEEELCKLTEDELFLVLYQAIHRFNHFELKEQGFEPEVEYLNNLEDLDPLDIGSNLYGCNKLLKVLNKAGFTNDVKKEIVAVVDDYHKYVQTSLAVKAMKVAKIELFTFLTNHKVVSRKLKLLVVKLYKELGDKFFMSCGADIKAGKSWLDYLERIDNRFIVRNRNWLDLYTSQSLIERLIENHEEFLTDEEFEQAMAITGEEGVEEYDDDEDIPYLDEDEKEYLTSVGLIKQEYDDEDEFTDAEDCLYEMHTEFNKGLSDFLKGYKREDSLFNKISKYNLYFRDFEGIEDMPYDPVENYPSAKNFEV